MLTMSRPNNFSNLNEEGRRGIENSNTSLDPRKRASPRGG